MTKIAKFEHSNQSERPSRSVSDGLYHELSGSLDALKVAPPRKGDRIVFSDLRQGSARSDGTGFAIKYVARGRVYHHVGRRTIQVNAGQFLCMPEGVPSEVEICRTDAASMIGACVFLSSSVATSDEGPALEEPLVFAAQCSRLGMLLGREVARFRGSTTLNSSVRAAELLRLVGNEIEGLLEDTSRDLASLNSMKVGTRYEGLRRLNLVRAYLHAVTDRAVDLGELARVAGLSRFQLLRDFRSCFGVPPITYHRRLRLQLASDEISRGQLSCYQAAERYGFADSSSLSRAHRRMFGTAPVRSLRSSFQCSAG